MLKKLLFAFTLLITTISLAQIKGKVSDEKGNPLPFVNIFEENTYNGTTSNDQGQFELNLKTSGSHTIVFQYLGYKTIKKTVTTDKTPIILDVVLAEENIILNEVVINPKDNPANEIIRNAIKNKKENSAKTARYTADFYSRGIFRVKNLPKTILGQKL
ncbi:MAG: carboxypeptidase-like regulatory domain-containing protein, partial [Flavobacterium sp.]|nr:carboxypeptidase-like regulatory domain-containing protein [Flavobacterium sp.]